MSEGRFERKAALGQLFAKNPRRGGEEGQKRATPRKIRGQFKGPFSNNTNYQFKLFPICLLLSTFLIKHPYPFDAADEDDYRL